MNINTFATDKNAEEAGVWVEAGDGLKLQIARITSQKYTRYLQKLGRPHARRLSATPDMALVEQLQRQAVAKCILLGWENLQEGKKDVLYEFGTALRLFEKYPDFYRLVLDYASDREIFVADNEEAILGNSQSASDGTSNGEST